jgi:ABC-type nitrate/sulfonate/bicarbonate transport system permease component
MGIFELRGSLTRQQSLLLFAIGVGLLLGIWHLLTTGSAPVLSSAILPHPQRVLFAFQDLYLDNDIIKNACHSIGINLAGYLEAIFIALPLGFLIGLMPIFRGAFQRPLESIRYIPLTAVTGLFIVWFGVGTSMKVHFLAFGILIYLLPVIIQRIDEVEDVFLKTVYTLGATNWQTIRTVYWPSVVSRLSDDIRVLTAISWTYIIVAENIDSTQGGLGALIWRVGQRQGRMDKVFALLILIVLIGVLQDRLFKRMDRLLFPYKYQASLHGKHGTPTDGSQKGIFSVLLSYMLDVVGGHQFRHVLHLILDYILKATWWIVLAAYWVLAVNEWTGLVFPVQLIHNLFGDTTWAIHTIMFLLTAYQVWKFRESHLGRYARLVTENQIA